MAGTGIFFLIRERPVDWSLVDLFIILTRTTTSRPAAGATRIERLITLIFVDQVQAVVTMVVIRRELPRVGP